MKHIHKLSVQIIIAVLLGLAFAGVGTKITYDCPRVDETTDIACVSYEKAVMHPGDLVHNKQDSLVKFSETFAVTALISFTLLTIISLAQKKKI